ncbi:A/G-specific adenine glycosylase [Parvularcula lutaonensis]|uniref:Adenine DNA glycosylase n=1 Tax=Parvularcula lutaonensis TaxID=491923 RepID=A0ABV7M7R6_9PROT|nr:A/G-specific adenine glycosylase [Parvularcula lutaonensis]GGY42116.1 A/G-specific adenine glycosylase [Parvularcula lutaonensis]
MRKTEGFGAALLAWYDTHARVLPWRAQPGENRRADPYHVLLSEVMLQQTTVAVVEKRFPQFLDQFPDLKTLAEAPEADVMAAWAGLGYYRRARSLHACAKALMAQHGGVFPQDEKALKALPGIGDYTSAAISAIAFGEPAVVVDGNIERVVTRVARVTDEMPGAKKLIKGEAAKLMPDARFGDYAQAMMDLGARVCRPKAPDCLLCPVRSYCAVAGSAEAESLPRKAHKRKRKTVQGVMIVLRREDGAVLCEERPADGLFGGMLGLPGGGWDGRAVPEVAATLRDAGGVTHILTHRRLEIDVKTGPTDGSPGDGVWMQPDEARAAMPTLFVKALERALS